LPPGRFGLYDLLGNVWEWTASRFKAHPFSKQQIPEYEQDLKVAKGGSWVSSLDSCRASARAAFPANERKATLGFRCVRLVESTEETE
jgi:formylglycine-generating enzyme required for sulfatase activity